MADPVNEQVILCSECFTDEGLRLSALMWGADNGSACPNCGKEGDLATISRQKPLGQLVEERSGDPILIAHGVHPFIRADAHSLNQVATHHDRAGLRDRWCFS